MALWCYQPVASLPSFSFLFSTTEDWVQSVVPKVAVQKNHPPVVPTIDLLLFMGRLRHAYGGSDTPPVKKPWIGWSWMLPLSSVCCGSGALSLIFLLGPKTRWNSEKKAGNLSSHSSQAHNSALISCFLSLDLSFLIYKKRLLWGVALELVTKKVFIKHLFCAKLYNALGLLLNHATGDCHNGWG